MKVLLFLSALVLIAQSAQAGPAAYGSCVAVCTASVGTVVAVAGAGPVGYVASAAGCITTYCMPLLFAFTP